jgi:putative hydroxymethylpyrimidine transport system substrate-binding protein
MVTAMKRVAAPLAAALLAAAATLFVAACGGSGAEPGASNEATTATLVLDFQPNPVHTGIYRAHRQQYYADKGINLTVREPSASTDAPKLLEADRAQFAIMDIHDLGIAVEKGFDLVGVMPIVQRPLASVLAGPSVARPRDLEGKTVGVTGLPSDDAVLDSVVAADGGDPSKVDRVTIGFNAVAALAAGKVDAATGFWNAEGVTLERHGVPIHEFRVDDYGAPKYPELVLTATHKLVDSDPKLVGDVVAATTHGYQDVVDQPRIALEDFFSEVQPVDLPEQHAEFLALTKADSFSPPGEFNSAALDDWARWDVEHGVLTEPPNVGQTFDLDH